MKMKELFKCGNIKNALMHELLDCDILDYKISTLVSGYKFRALKSGRDYNGIKLFHRAADNSIERIREDIIDSLLFKYDIKDDMISYLNRDEFKENEVEEVAGKWFKMNINENNKLSREIADELIYLNTRVREEMINIYDKVFYSEYINFN